MRLVLVTLSVLVLAVGCGDDGAASGDGGLGGDDGGGSGMDGATAGDGSTTGSDGSTTGGDGSTGSLDAGVASDAAIPDGANVLPDGRVIFCENCECSNGIDDDGDGFVDGFDAECTGPYDNDEGSFATGIPGDNRDPMWQDCFFDGNSGSGDDKCRYRTGCLTGELESTDPDCTVSAMCIDNCQPRTPNGCDCFGCCEVTTDSGDTLFVTLAETCSLDTLNDETACPRCEQSTQCVNECGECELCPGREVEDLPASCFESPDGGTADGGADGGTGGGGYTCDNGEQVCSESMPCPDGYYCQLGCCLTVLF
jgi:hypothetical protein